MNSLIINKKDLRHNINVIKEEQRKTSKDSKYTIIGVVKGNGYGLGLVEYSKFLINNGIEVLAVATSEEAIELKQAEIKEDVINLSTVTNEEELQSLVQNNIIITIGSKKCADIANGLAKKGEKIRAHIKIDTGFGRYGFLYNHIEEIIETIKNLNENIKIEGIFSHFSLAYYKNSKWCYEQYNRFLKIIEELEKNNININLKHMCNSPAFINYPEMRLNAARIGSAFLGRVDIRENIGLKTIGQMQVNIAEIKILPKNFNVGYLNLYKTKRETKVAIIPIGYKDGYNIGTRQDMLRFIDKLRDLYHDFKRLFKKQNLYVIINNRRYPVIGKTGMYHIAVDITGTEITDQDMVYVNINPVYIDSKVRREYI